jgi:hypothetical protein
MTMRAFAWLFVMKYCVGRIETGNDVLVSGEPFLITWTSTLALGRQAPSPSPWGWPARWS